MSKSVINLIDFILTIALFAFMAVIAITVGILTLYVTNNSAIAVIMVMVTMGVIIKIIKLIIN